MVISEVGIKLMERPEFLRSRKDSIVTERTLKDLLSQLADKAEITNNHKDVAGATPWRDLLKDFLNQHAEVVHRYCLGIFRKRKHHPADAENLALNAFLNIWQAVDRHPPKEPTTVLPWIRCIATNLSIDHRKKEDAEAKMHGPNVDDVAVRDPVDSFTELQDEEVSRVVRKAVSQLPARNQMVVIQHMNGRTHKEIAQIIGASEKTSQRLWQEALDLLRPFLSDYV